MFSRRHCHRFNVSASYITVLVMASVIPSFTEADDQRLVVDQSQNIHLDCIVKNFKFGVVSSKWSKQQTSSVLPLLLFVDDRPFRPMAGDFARYNTTHTEQTNGYTYSLNIYSE